MFGTCRPMHYMQPDLLPMRKQILLNLAAPLSKAKAGSLFQGPHSLGMRVEGLGIIGSCPRRNKLRASRSGGGELVVQIHSYLSSGSCQKGFSGRGDSTRRGA